MCRHRGDFLRAADAFDIFAVVLTEHPAVFDIIGLLRRGAGDGCIAQICDARLTGARLTGARLTRRSTVRNQVSSKCMDRGHLGTLLPYYDQTIAESMAGVQMVKHNLVKISPQFKSAATRF
jgi:hypothetical protein